MRSSWQAGRRRDVRSPRGREQELYGGAGDLGGARTSFVDRHAAHRHPIVLDSERRVQNRPPVPGIRCTGSSPKRTASHWTSRPRGARRWMPRHCTSVSTLSGLNVEDVAAAKDIDFSQPAQAIFTLEDGAVVTIAGVAAGDKRWSRCNPPRMRRSLKRPRIAPFRSRAIGTTPFSARWINCWFQKRRGLAPMPAHPRAARRPRSNRPLRPRPRDLRHERRLRTALRRLDLRLAAARGAPPRLHRHHGGDPRKRDHCGRQRFLVVSLSGRRTCDRRRLLRDQLADERCDPGHARLAPARGQQYRQAPEASTRDLAMRVRLFAWSPAALGVLWLYADPEHLALHDRLSGTRVLHLTDSLTGS